MSSATTSAAPCDEPEATGPSEAAPSLKSRAWRMLVRLGGRLAELWSPLSGWYLAALAACGMAGVNGLLLGYRVVEHSTIGKFIQSDDIPLLHYVETHYAKLYWTQAGCAGFLLLALLAGYRTVRSSWTGWTWAGLTFFGAGLASYAQRFVKPESGPVTLHAPNALDWLWVAALGLAASCGAAALARRLRGVVQPEPAVLARGRWIPARVAVLYLLGCIAVLTYALMDHLGFWSSAKNGGYNYRQFFEPGELGYADLVLYSTSWLFASLAALSAAAGVALFWLAEQRLREPDGSEGLRAALLGAVWSGATMLPWLAKMLPEIRGEGAWILPVGLCGATFAAVVPLLAVSLVTLRLDLDGAAAEHPASTVRAAGGDRALAAFVLFPFYPLIRMARPPRTWRPWVSLVALLLVCGLAVAGFTWGIDWADRNYDLDDWRKMLKSGLFPCLRVLAALACAAWVYLAFRRVVEPWFRAEPEEPAAKWPNRIRYAAVALACAGILGASWPFWGWQRVPQNVFARLAEFSKRHEFELGFLHWMGDFDGDGYAAWLNGADLDESNPTVQAGGLFKPVAVPLIPDVVEVVDPEKSVRFPSVVVLWLEGVAPRLLSCYGQRKLPEGVLATPHMDALAADGTRFAHARCVYPSTWDGWYMTQAGRFLRVLEMDNSKPFGETYARHNNLLKILKLAGVTRYAHADTVPFVDLFVPERYREENFEKDLNSEPDSKLEIMRGDKRTDRLVRFIESLEPGEKFFLCEHMTDTHFPWKRTSLKRAQELGFPDGLEFCEADAIVDGVKNDKLARHCQTVTRMDGQIGRIVKALKDRGLYDETLILIVSDHGCQWFEHEHMYYVSHLYEQSLRIPMILKVPGMPRGLVCETPVLQTDLIPTFLELAGMRIAPPAKPLDGLSLVPFLRGVSDVDDAPYRKRNLILTTHYDTLGVVRAFRDKMIFDRPTGTYCIFDIESDPMEKHNLVDTRPELKDELLELLREMQKKHPEFLGGIADPPGVLAAHP